jgi:ABC-type transport system involved in multi-copper enzyme maturation permease subunit
MRGLPRKWKLPLLAKELAEQAARERTYVIRFAYTSLLFVVTCVLFYGNLSSDGTTSVLGRGRSMFNQLVTLQFGGIYLLLPAMVCSVISSEKEKDSLSLLMLTTLTPWQIVIQKLFGRLIPMFNFLFISFPLMAIAFSNGGVTVQSFVVRYSAVGAHMSAGWFVFHCLFGLLPHDATRPLPPAIFASFCCAI